MKLGLDISLRSSAYCLTDNNKIVELFIQQSKEKTYEKLLKLNEKRFEEILKYLTGKYDIEVVNIEGLSLGSKSSYLDVISANFWNHRCLLHDFKMKFDIYSPAQWRKIHEIIPKDKKQKEYKSWLGKDYLKILAMKKLDDWNNNVIMEFCYKNKLKNKSEYDLTDAYWVSCC